MSTNTSKPLRIRRVNHSDEIVTGFSKLLKNESMTDVTLICNGGQTIRAHRVILSTFSSYFKAIFESQPFNTYTCQYPVIVIKDLSFNQLRTVIEFIYKGEVSVSQDNLYSILQAGKALNVSGLIDLKCDNYINCNSKNLPSETISTNGLNTSLSSSPNGVKVRQETLDELVSSELESQLKKKPRVALDSGNLDKTLGLCLLGNSNLRSDDVKSLLQQVSRLTAMENLKADLQMQKPSRSSSTLEQLFQLKKRAILSQKLQLQQNQIKNQILQQQLTKSSDKLLDENKNITQNDDLIRDFYNRLVEKLKTQINDKHKLSDASSISDKVELSSPTKTDTDQQRKPLSDEEIICPDDIDQETGEKINKNTNETMNEDEKDISVTNGEKSDSNEDDSKNQNGEINGKSDDEKEENMKCDTEVEEVNLKRLKIEQIEKLDVEGLMEEDEDYDTEIEKDSFFQRQQSLRLEQLRRQQHFQNQLKLQLQQEQEANLLELQQQLQQIDSPNEPEDLSTNLSLDWQEGFVDVSFPNISTVGNNMSLSLWPQNQNGGQNKTREASSTTGPTPDFLLPRGPGRPRKGNKTQDISPCPECNKVFVRPDVLKLHYRSVHLNERHPCNMCSKIFKWPGDLSKHKRTKHREEMGLAINNNNNNGNNNNKNSGNTNNQDTVNNINNIN